MIYLDSRFLEIARPIIEHEEYQQMRKIKHHDESVFDHSLKVAFYAYRMAYKHNLDWRATIRGALLHDFFLYKFKKSLSLRIITDSIKHAIVHPLIAYDNAIKHFDLNEKEENIIKAHMFPFGLPKSKEAWIVSYVDKYIAVFEYASNFKKMAKRKPAYSAE
ncbi:MULTISPECIES: HD domain-containing protein [unclassified Sedimentibacter]|uniref:HD domain-containing protein n=1 Tax=unclassified Sedimentibacter TaxID=2649220 RepID=UPI0027E199A6|nr:HD domain-containing protein [Sedimentibacter sp. MB35-C1]WMJ78107.1 HD domain-containing protein [Sedimentibacter sp. MB35-C1]